MNKDIPTDRTRLAALLSACLSILPACAARSQAQAQDSGRPGGAPAAAEPKAAPKKDAGQTQAGKKRHPKKKNRGYDYDGSRYLSKSEENNVYRFNARGEPVVSGKPLKKKEKPQGEGGAEAGLALQSTAPKQKLQKVGLDGRRRDPSQAADASSQIPPGMLPPGVNLGNLANPGGNR